MAIGSEIEKLERRWQENPSGLMFAPLAEAYRKAGNHQRALEILELGLTVHPDYVPALIVRGRCFLDTANLVGAEAAFQQVLLRDPMNPIALRGVADVYERSGRSSLSFELPVEPEPVPEPPVVPVPEALEPVNEPEPPVLVIEPTALAFEIENLSVDPIAEPPVEAVPEIRLPWEPLPMPEPSFARLVWTPVIEAVPEAASGSLPAEVSPPAPVDEVVVAEAIEVMELVEEAPEAPIGAEMAPPEPPTDMVADEVAPAPVWGESLPMIESGSPPPPESPEAAFAWPELEPAAEAVEAAEPPMAAEADEVAVMAAAELPQPEPALVVTESMAELFLKQGHRELALAVYRQLRDRDPSLGHLEQVIAGLEAELRPSMEPAGMRPEFAASATGGVSVHDFLTRVLQSPPPLAGAAVLPPAIEPMTSGEPARPLEQPLSLGSVFGDEPQVAPRGADAEPPAPSAEPSYDEFFGAVAAGEPAAAGSAPSRSSEGEDLRQFNDWLKGLKR
jgi:tetratricopeptide (TPR) repeat protein